MFSSPLNNAVAPQPTPQPEIAQIQKAPPRYSAPLNASTSMRGKPVFAQNNPAVTAQLTQQQAIDKTALVEAVKQTGQDIGGGISSLAQDVWKYLRPDVERAKRWQSVLNQYNR